MLGHRRLIATDQRQLLQDYDVPVGRYWAGSVASLSFDEGFTRAPDWELLRLYAPTVVMPQRGKKTAADTERESDKNPATLISMAVGHADQRYGWWNSTFFALFVRSRMLSTSTPEAKAMAK